MKGLVLVTGASTGIGRECALHMDRLGYQVFAGVRRQVDGDALAKEASTNLTPILLDVADERSIAKAEGHIREDCSENGLVGLVNNAGIAVAGPLEFIPIPELRRQMEVNVIGQVAVTQAFLPLLRKAHGRIIFISSISGRVASPLLGPYAASKFALEALADALRRELYPWGLHVSVVEPGRIETPIWEKSVASAVDLLNGLPPEVETLYGGLIDARREGALKGTGGAPVEAVARAVEHALVSLRPKTRYLVGRDARIGALAVRLLPDRLLDRILAHRR